MGLSAGLGYLVAAGCNVLKTFCISSDVYEFFLDNHGLRDYQRLKTQPKCLTNTKAACCSF